MIDKNKKKSSKIKKPITKIMGLHKIRADSFYGYRPFNFFAENTILKNGVPLL